MVLQKTILVVSTNNVISIDFHSRSALYCVATDSIKHQHAFRSKSFTMKTQWTKQWTSKLQIIRSSNAITALLKPRCKALLKDKSSNLSHLFMHSPAILHQKLIDKFYLCIGESGNISSPSDTEEPGLDVASVTPFLSCSIFFLTRPRLFSNLLVSIEAARLLTDFPGFASGLIIHQEDLPVPSFWTRMNLLCNERLCLIEFCKERN